jgi:hypothetical protein
MNARDLHGNAAVDAAIEQAANQTTPEDGGSKMIVMSQTTTEMSPQARRRDRRAELSNIPEDLRQKAIRGVLTIEQARAWTKLRETFEKQPGLYKTVMTAFGVPA